MNIDDDPKGKTYKDGISDAMQVIRYYAKYNSGDIDPLSNYEKGLIGACESLNTLLEERLHKLK